MSATVTPAVETSRQCRPMRSRRSNTTLRSRWISCAMTDSATASKLFGSASIIRCRSLSRMVTSTTTCRLLIRSRLSISSSAVTVSTNSVNRMTSARRLSLMLSSASPSVKFVSSAL